MIIDCPACGAGLMFDPESGKMKCEACGSLFDPSELEDDFQAKGEKELNKDFAKHDNAGGVNTNSSDNTTAGSGLKLSGSSVAGSGLHLAGDNPTGSGLHLAGNNTTGSGLHLAGNNTTGSGLNLSENTPGISVANSSPSSIAQLGMKLTGATLGPGGVQFVADMLDNNQTGASSGYNNTSPEEPSFNPNSDFDHPIYDHTDDYGQEEYNSTGSPDEMMECNIYTCTSCGAEVAINNVEASTFCSFCGQPTVVFNRVASQKKPKYIIPFSVTKERAISLIRERLNKGFYVPEAIKNFEIERVRGIYVPFWLYDIYYHDSQYLKGTVGSGKNSHTYYYYREADCEFTRLTLDASKQLNDETSQRLEPYNTDAIKDFSLEYLSGFYADCFDMGTSQLDRLALTRTQTMFQTAVDNSIDAHSISVLKNSPDFKIRKTEYAMFPAWFLTFRYEEIPYTLLVNGQTEKIIGGVPYDKTKVAVSFGILAAILTVIATFIIYGILLSDDEDTMKMLISILIFSGALLGMGMSNLKKVKESATLTSLSETNNFVKNRGK